MWPGRTGRSCGTRRCGALQIVYGTSVVAEWGFLVALSVFAYDVRGATGVGIVGVVRMVPAALATPFAAVLSDRFRRERVLLWIELGSAIAMAGAAVAFFAGPAEVTIYALAGLLAIIATLLRPTVAALLPSLATTPAELVAANAASLTTESLGTLAGPLLAGLVVATTNAGVVFAGAAGIYAVAGDPRPPRPGRRAAGADSGGEADRRAARRLSRRRAGSSTAAPRRALRSPDPGAGRAQRPDRRHRLPSAPCRWELGRLPHGCPRRRRPARRIRLGCAYRATAGGSVRHRLAALGDSDRRARAVAEQGLGALSCLPSSGSATRWRTWAASACCSGSFTTRCSPGCSASSGGWRWREWRSGPSSGRPWSMLRWIRGAAAATGLFLAAVVALSWRRLVSIDRAVAAPDAGAGCDRQGPDLPRACRSWRRSVWRRAWSCSRTRPERRSCVRVRPGIASTSSSRVRSRQPSEAVPPEGGRSTTSARSRCCATSPGRRRSRAKTAVRLYALERDDFLAAVTGYSSAMEAGEAVVAERLAPA